MSKWIPVCGSAAGLEYGEVVGLAEIRHSCLWNENFTYNIQKETQVKKVMKNTIL